MYAQCNIANFCDKVQNKSPSLPPPSTTSSASYNDPAMVRSSHLFSLQFNDQFINAVLFLLSNKHKLYRLIYPITNQSIQHTMHHAFGDC